MNCNLCTAAIVVVAPGETLSQAFVQKFIYDSFDDSSFHREVDSAIKEFRRNVLLRYSHLYGGKTLAVFGWYYDYTPQEHAHFIKFIRVKNVKEFKL